MNHIMNYFQTCEEQPIEDPSEEEPPVQEPVVVDPPEEEPSVQDPVVVDPVTDAPMQGTTGSGTTASSDKDRTTPTE